MEVMHNNQEALLTILEVLLYDPLNHWTISPQKAAALQSRRDRMDTETSELNATKDILTDIDETSTSVQQGLCCVNKVCVVSTRFVFCQQGLGCVNKVCVVSTRLRLCQ
jgi:hypothetical protein